MLSQSQLAAIDCLLGGMNQKDTAAKVGVAEASLSRWVNHDTAFQRELARAMNRVLQGTVMQHIGSLAQILAAMKDASVTAPAIKDRIAAGDKFIGRLLDLMERFDTKEILSRLECQLQESTDGLSQAHGSDGEGSSPENSPSSPCL